MQSVDLEKNKTENVYIEDKEKCPFPFSILYFSSSDLPTTTDFIYHSVHLDGVILSCSSFVKQVEDKITLQICTDCHSGFQKSKMPKFALANKLYRGNLLKDFADISFVEQMVCEKIWNTAHITRVFQSNDSSHSKVFHGNTCAHEMNVISTASVLPCTPSDINDMLRVVFIGPGKCKVWYLGSMFCVRKIKIWAFLVWLKENNHLYSC